MKKISFILVCIFVTALIISGCGGGQKMHQSKILNEKGLPKMVPQIDENARGKSIITITEELTYPGMKSYEGMTYEYLSADSPDKVAQYFADKLPGSTMEKAIQEPESDSFWTITYKDLIIRLYYYGGNQTIIKYKKQLPK
jgi:hypothetical protein